MVKFMSVAVVALLLCIFPMAVSAQGLLERGVSEYRAENFEEALELLSEALKEGPASSGVSYYLGLTNKRLGNLKGAIPHFKAAAKMVPPERAAFVELADIYFTLDDYREARIWLDLADKNGAGAGNVALLRGMILMKEKRFDDAIVEFDKAKSADPSLAPAADFQTAMAHASERRMEKARASLKAIISISPESDVADYARTYEKSFSNIIDKHRTWRGNLYAGYLYDDNAILKSRSPVAGLNYPRQGDSGFMGNFRLDYTPMLEGNKLFSAQYSANTTTYGERGDFNQVVQNISLIPGMSFANGAFMLPVSYSHAFLGGYNYTQIASARPTWYQQLAVGHIAQFSVGYSRREIMSRAFSVDENRDANIYSAGLGYLHTFAEGRGMVNIRYEATNDVAEGSNWANVGNRVTALLLTPLCRNVTATVSGDAFFQNYQNTNSFFGVRRNDTIWNATAGVSWQMIRDLKLNLQYVHTRAESNIYIYDYTRNIIQAGLEIIF